MVELADAPDSKSGGSDTVRVRFPPSAPIKNIKFKGTLDLKPRVPLGYVYNKKLNTINFKSYSFYKIL